MRLQQVTYAVDCDEQLHSLTAAPRSIPFTNNRSHQSCAAAYCVRTCDRKEGYDWAMLTRLRQLPRYLSHDLERISSIDRTYGIRDLLITLATCRKYGTLYGTPNAHLFSALTVST